MATVYGVMNGLRPGVGTRAMADRPAGDASASIGRQVAFAGRRSADDDFADQPVRGHDEVDRAARLLDVRR